MKNLTQWLETVSQEEAAAKVDLEPTDVNNVDEASDQGQGGEKLSSESNSVKHEVDLEPGKEKMDVDSDAGDQEDQDGAHNEVDINVSKEDNDVASGEPTEPAESEPATFADIYAGQGEVVPTEEEAAADEPTEEPSSEPAVEEPTDEPTDVEPPLVDPVEEIKSDETPVTDEPVEEEELATEDFDAAANDDITAGMDGVVSDVDELSNIETSLEAYGELLRAELATGGTVSPALAKAIQIGLESFHEPMLTEALPSLEDYADPSGKFVVSNELMEGLSAKGKMVGKAIVEAIKRLWEMLEEIYREISLDVPKLSAKNNELIDRLKSTEDAGKGTVDIKGARKLYIGDMFAGNKAENIKKVHQVGDAFMSQYPKMFKAMINDYKKTTRGIMSDKDGEQSITAMMGAFSDNFKPEQLGLKAIDRSKAPSSFSKYAGIAASDALLGNRRFFAGLNESKIVIHGTPSGSATENALISLGNVFKVEFAHEEKVASSGTDDIIKLPDVATLRRLADETATLTERLEAYATVSREFGEIRRELDAATMKLHGLDNLNGTLVNKLFYVSRGLAKAVTVPSGHFVGYVANIVRVLQAFISHCIAAHAAAAKPVAEA